MAAVTIKDDSIWISHIEGDEDLALFLRNMGAGERVLLLVDGFPGIWIRMLDDRDGRPRLAIKPTGQAKERWLQLHASRRTVVTVERPSFAGVHGRRAPAKRTTVEEPDRQPATV